jgi:hypothetical protein
MATIVTTDKLTICRDREFAVPDDWLDRFPDLDMMVDAAWPAPVLLARAFSKVA